MRSGVLSEDSVISTVNEFFVPFSINVTKDGFPKQVIPALTYLESVYQTNWRFSFGFAGAVVIDNEGKFPLGHSAASKHELSLQDYFGSRSFLLFLVESLERHKQVTEIRGKFRQGNFQAAFIELQNFITKLIAGFGKQAQELVKMQREWNSMDWKN